MGSFPWESGPTIMGVINTSPESFYEDSIHEGFSAVVTEAERMIDAGAEIIDIGGESNRPGAELMDKEVEIERIEPYIEELAGLHAQISIDTWRASVAAAAIETGADIINDISGLADPEMRHVAAEYDVPIVVGHSSDVIAERPTAERSDDVIDEVRHGLRQLVGQLLDSGVDEDKILVDPGIGFGKTEREDIELIARLDELRGVGSATLIGHSRKWRPTTFKEDHLAGIEDPDDPDVMLPSTIALSTVAVENGADIIRVHDVFENSEALHVGDAVRSFNDRR